MALVVASVLSPTAALAVSTTPRVTPLFNGSVYAIAYRGNTVYVGGTFTYVISGGRTYQRLRLAAFDARSGALLSWAPEADGPIRSLAATDTDIYAAGDFSTISGQRRDNLARLARNTGVVASFAHTVNGVTYSLAIGNGRLYLGGRFDEVDGEWRDNLAAFSLSDGSLDSDWQPNADDTVHAVVAAGSRVYLGGAFHLINDVKGTLRLAAVSATDGTVDRGFLPKSPAQVNAIAVDGAGIYAAGAGQGGRASAYTVAGKLRWEQVFDGDAAAIAALGGVVYIGGHFDKACLTTSNGPHGDCTSGSVPRVKIAAVTAAGALTGWAPQANGVIGVRALAADLAHATMGAGGDFTMIGGRDRRRFASFG